MPSTESDHAPAPSKRGPDGVDPPGVIVIGMHRSATSLTTAVLVECGWRPTGPMLSATASNPRGFFEDRHIHELHKQLLATMQAGWDRAGRLRTLRRSPLPLAPLEDRVDELIASLRRGGPWVWKNPRATLFVEDWARRMPEARFVLCVRSPAQVIDSLQRRGSTFGLAESDRSYRIRRHVRALSVWHTYNKVAYRFALRHPDRVTVIRVPDDLPVLAASTQPSVFDPALLRETPPLLTRVIAGFALTSQLLYRRLRRLHDLRRLQAVLAGPPEPASRP